MSEVIIIIVLSILAVMAVVGMAIGTAMSFSRDSVCVDTYTMENRYRIFGKIYKTERDDRSLFCDEMFKEGEE